ncbi:MAG: DinB family protein [Chloroflexaceae bacterium]|jgi:hypothetical protein|nr:DinB family protein [Chloroflexaceae bacterium]
MPDAQTLRDLHMAMLELNLATLSNIVRSTSPERATTLRDGPDGWTTLEVLCHLRDIEEVMLGRAERIASEDNPAFTAIDADGLARERSYNGQDMHAVLGELSAHRQRLLAFFRQLGEEQWQRAGVHSRYGHTTMQVLLARAAWHDMNHIEQMTRILA